MKSRRTFIKKSGLLLAASTLPFPNILLNRPKEKLGVALVGLGNYSTGQLAPALQETEYCELKGIVTGSPEKIPKWQRQYDISEKNVYNYENMDDISNNDDIDVIYIVLPIGMHAEYAIKAAETGKHVWCEKAMATTALECRNMIDACEKNGVTMAIGYRMQHEQNTQKIMEWAKTRPFGPIENLKVHAGYYGSPMQEWKTKKDLGGGAILDMGVYPLNAARYATGMEPIAVSARASTNRPEVFKNVEETMEFNLEFPEGVTANCKTSFGESMNRLEINCKKGWYYLEPFQSYNNVGGKTSNGTKLKPWNKNQQAVQMDDDAKAILNNTALMVPGEEGLRDIAIIDKIYESAANNGKRIRL